MVTLVTMSCLLACTVPAHSHPATAKIKIFAAYDITGDAWLARRVYYKRRDYWRVHVLLFRYFPVLLTAKRSEVPPIIVGYDNKWKISRYNNNHEPTATRQTIRVQQRRTATNREKRKACKTHIAQVQ